VPVPLALYTATAPNRAMGPGGVLRGKSLSPAPLPKGEGFLPAAIPGRWRFAGKGYTLKRASG